VVCGWPEEVEKLIAQGTSVEVEDSYGSTPLILAAVNGHEDICRLLIVHGALIEAQNNYGWTPLIWAASRGHMNVCRLLIEKNASVETKDDIGLIPLYYAADKGYEDLCKLLIDTQLKSARENKATIATFLGIVRKRGENLPCHMHYDVAKIIARQAFETVRQKKWPVIEQIHKLDDQEKAQWSAYVKQQMNSPIK
jgi:ankyrin repeat protein